MRVQVATDYPLRRAKAPGITDEQYLADWALEQAVDHLEKQGYVFDPLKVEWIDTVKSDKFPKGRVALFEVEVIE